MSIMVLLRLMHILAGITWVGAMIFTVFFLIPALKDDGATLGKVFQGLMKRGYMQVMPAVAIVTILSGLWMIRVTSNGMMDVYMQSRAGRTFTTAGGLAIIGFLIGMFVARPAGMRAAGLMGQMANSSDNAEKARLQGEVAALQKRNGAATMIVAVLVIAAAAGMAIARYV